MPKKQILGISVVLIILSFICMYIYDNFKVVNTTKLVIKEKKECTGNLDLYYTDSRGNNYYLYCLDKITVDYGDRKLDLNKALERKQITMDFVYEQVKENGKTDSYSDGGSIKYNNDNFSLISCQTDLDNKDYYFGPSNMEYREGFCIEEPYACTFTKTYLVLDTSNSDDQKYVYLTLKEYQSEEVATIKIKRDNTFDFVEDIYYEFKFGSIGKSKNEDIETIFNSNLLLMINQSDKLEHINESICK